MKLLANSVSDHFTDDRESSILNMVLHLFGDLAPFRTFAHQADCQVQRFMGVLEEPFVFIGYVTDWMSYGGVTAPAGNFAAGIDADDIAINQFSGAWNSVNDFFIGRDACHRRKRRPRTCTAIIQEKWFRIVVPKRFNISHIDLGGRNAGTNQLRSRLVGLPDNEPSDAHLLDFAARTKDKLKLVIHGL